jgi:predicted dehydrogenase
MTKSRPLGVAIAGLGFGEKVHLPALRACPEAVPVALWHPRQERVEQASRTAELPGSSNFDAVLDDPAVEAVVIATPPAARFELAQKALQAGKHLLLEKPVALNASEAQQLEKLALTQDESVPLISNIELFPLFNSSPICCNRAGLVIPGCCVLIG